MGEMVQCKTILSHLPFPSVPLVDPFTLPSIKALAVGVAVSAASAVGGEGWVDIVIKFGATGGIIYVAYVLLNARIRDDSKERQELVEQVRKARRDHLTLSKTMVSRPIMAAMKVVEDADRYRHAKFDAEGDSHTRELREDLAEIKAGLKELTDAVKDNSAFTE